MTYSTGTAPRNGLILIYQDEGTSHESCLGLKHHLSRQFLYNQIKFADSGYLNKDSWPNRVSLLIFPGGACTPWEKNLGTIGVLKIKNYIEEYGGRVLGICAGAYFFAQISCYETGKISIHRKRDISLFPGVASGPLTFCERPLSAPPRERDLSDVFDRSLSMKSSSSLPSLLEERALPSILSRRQQTLEAPLLVKLCLSADDTTSLYPYLGGPALTSDKAYTVIATYPDSPGSPTATLGFSSGSGTLVACSPHPELTNPEDPNPLLQQIVNFLFPGDDFLPPPDTLLQTVTEDDALAVDFS